MAYFGHTQRYDDGVRHQGGYLATVDASGAQDLIDGWFGSLWLPKTRPRRNP